MNIKELIETVNKVGAKGITKEISDQVWAKEQGKSLSEDQIRTKTYDVVKLIESLVVRDKAQKFIQPETMSLQILTILGEKVKKVTPYNLWMNIIGADGKVAFGCVYADCVSRNAIILDGAGKEVVSGKGWKKVRDYFRTEVDPPKTEPAKEEKPKAKAKKVASKKSKPADPPVQVASEEVVAEKVSLDEFIEPEIPEELVG